MAYAESTLSGTYGSYYRVWVNSIRTWDGGPADNSEDWRVEGGLNKIATGTSAYNGMNQASYTLQLGLNGVASSGNYSYNFSSGQTGTVLAWGTGSTKVYRNSAGEGFGFQSRMDINLANSAIGSGWVTSNDGVQTKYRHASLTALSTDAGGIPFTDEGPAWVEWSNPSGAAVDAWLEIPGTGRIFTSGSVGSRYNYVFNTTLMNAIRAASPNSNTYTIRIGVHDSMGGDNWDWRDRTGTIKNDLGQANPTFTDFTYADTNSATVTVTGSNQVLVQGKSTLDVTVSTANKATANKSATMSNYTYTLGGYSGTATWSNTAAVVKTIGTVSDVTGTQSLSVRAVDSRTNGKTISKNVTILPYSSPIIVPGLRVKYTNDYNTDAGISVTAASSIIANISPMTLSGTDKNAVVAASGIKFDLSKGNNSSYSGTPVNIPTTQAAGTGVITADLTALANSILTKMNTMTADNTTVWYIKFTITDKLETKSYETAIDIGRSIFRIGADGKLYHNEIEFHKEFGDTFSVFIDPHMYVAGTGTWGVSTGTGFSQGPKMVNNASSSANGDYVEFTAYLSPGTYKTRTGMMMGTTSGIVDVTINGTPQYTVDLYASATSGLTVESSNIVIASAGPYTWRFKANGKNAASTAYRLSIFFLDIYR